MITFLYTTDTPSEYDLMGERKSVLFLSPNGKVLGASPANPVRTIVLFGNDTDGVVDVNPCWYSSFNNNKIVIMKDPRIAKNLESLQKFIASCEKEDLWLIFSSSLSSSSVSFRPQIGKGANAKEQYWKNMSEVCNKIAPFAKVRLQYLFEIDSEAKLQSSMYKHDQDLANSLKQIKGHPMENFVGTKNYFVRHSVYGKIISLPYKFQKICRGIA